MSRIARISMLDQYKYVSHKLLRWLTAYLLAAGLICMVASLMAAGSWALAAALVVAVALGGALIWKVRSGPLGQLREVLGAFIATGIGVWCSLRGQRFQTWAPPNSARGAAA
jgi:hypothetical protein